MIVRCIDDSEDVDFRLCLSDWPRKGELYYVRSPNGRIMYQSGGLLVVQFGYLLEEIQNNPCLCMFGHEPGFFARRFVESRHDFKKLLEPMPTEGVKPKELV
jgi:hypothetical protein